MHAGEQLAQGVGDAHHDLCEAAWQHPDQVLVLWHILVHTAIVVVEASLWGHGEERGRAATRQRQDVGWIQQAGTLETNTDGTQAELRENV